MKTITMTNTGQTTPARFASPQAAYRGLSVGVGSPRYAPMDKARAVKDVAHLRSGRPLV